MTYIRLSFAALAVLSLAPALAHDHGEGAWINQMSLIDPVTREFCCGPQDCAPLPAGGISENAFGFRIAETGEQFAQGRVIWKAPDGRLWRCRYLAGPEKGKTRCLIGPPRGM